MLTAEQFQQYLSTGPKLLDGATGSCLQKAGMPRDCCTGQWILEHPETILRLQESYAQAGCQIIYTPTFQAQPIALEKVGLAEQTEKINSRLAALTRQAAPNALIAGDIATLAAYSDSFDNLDLLIENYSRQIRGLIDGGVDLIVGETLLYPRDAEAIRMALEMEGGGAVMFSFTMRPDGSLFSGGDAAPVLQELAQAGAAAVGFNCVAAGADTAALVSKLRRQVRAPILCKPSAGIPILQPDGTPHYPMEPEEFSAILADCAAMGASLLGGCCGTDPAYLTALAAKMRFVKAEPIP